MTHDDNSGKEDSNGNDDADQTCSAPPTDPSVIYEPQNQTDRFVSDPSELRALEVLHHEARRQHSTEEVDHSVWEEPALSLELVHHVSKPEYGEWLAQRRRSTTTMQSWLIAVLAALCGGPFAVIGVLVGSIGQPGFQLLAIVLFGPVAEEVMKAAVPLLIVEKRPYLFQSRAQIVLCAIGSGLAFASIENLLYLNVYVPEPSTLLIHWRWTVCVALHIGCAVIYALGSMRTWEDALRRMARPRIELSFPYAIVAMILHATYNTIAVALSLAQYNF